MFVCSVLALSVAAAAPSGDGWEVAAHNEHVTVYARERPDTGFQEMQAEGVIDAPPAEVWRALRDYDRHPQTMPYVEVARVLRREDGDKVMYVYNVVNPPMVSRRDYVLRIVDESAWKDGQGFLKLSWRTANARAPQRTKNAVRVEVNDGFWLLQPAQGGTSTRAVYYIHTDPGGGVPKWIVNRVNGTAIPDIWEAVRRAAKAH
jgi:hypothetical protein